MDGADRTIILIRAFGYARRPLRSSSRRQGMRRNRPDMSRRQARLQVGCLRARCGKDEGWAANQAPEGRVAAPQGTLRERWYFRCCRHTLNNDGVID